MCTKSIKRFTCFSGTTGESELSLVVTIQAWQAHPRAPSVPLFFIHAPTRISRLSLHNTTTLATTTTIPTLNNQLPLELDRIKASTSSTTVYPSASQLGAHFPRSSTVATSDRRGRRRKKQCLPAARWPRRGSAPFAASWATSTLPKCRKTLSKMTLI
jgi:hypothetical protein